jgi:4-coumarate--CoA ligase
VLPGTPGEVLVRGPIVTNGYFRNEKATKEAFRNGWFATGDIAVERGGKFYIVDRLKELIKYKGNQVAPAEIETTLDQHPWIAEAAVVGVPEGSEHANEKGVAFSHSEVPRAYVVRSDKRLSAGDVKDWVAKKLAPYKQLRGGVVFVEELPHNAIGKLLRKDLRERAAMEIKRERLAKL